MKNCEQENAILTSNPPQYRCKNCGQVWSSVNQTPVCSMNTKDQWEKEFNQIWSLADDLVTVGAIINKIDFLVVLKDFIRETREQAKKEERDKILETLWNTPSSMIPEALQRISKQ